VRQSLQHIRNDKDLEFVSGAVKEWLKDAGLETLLFIAAGNP